MKVQFLEPMGGKDFVYETNVSYDLPKKQAERFIEHGICIEYTEEAIAEVKANSQVIKPAKKSKKK